VLWLPRSSPVRFVPRAQLGNPKPYLRKGVIAQIGEYPGIERLAGVTASGWRD